MTNTWWEPHETRSGWCIRAVWWEYTEEGWDYAWDDEPPTVFYATRAEAEAEMARRGLPTGPCGPCVVIEIRAPEG